MEFTNEDSDPYSGWGVDYGMFCRAKAWSAGIILQGQDYSRCRCNLPGWRVRHVYAYHCPAYGPVSAGNSAIVVENMAGAGHIIGANHVYKVAKPDGLTLGHFQGGLFPQQLLGRPGIEFDARKFEYIGAPGIDTPACAFTKESGITSVEKWSAAKIPVKVGGTGAGLPDDVPRILAGTLKLPVQLISGFKGTSEIRMAAESGEIAGGCWT